MAPLHNVFISFSSKDEAIVSQILESLKEQGLTCWISFENIAPGEIWSKSIIQGISDSEVFLLILTPESNSSHQVMRELDYAINKKKPIFCFQTENFKLSDVIVYYTSSLHRIEAFNRDSNIAIEKLINDILKLVGNSAILTEKREEKEIIMPKKLVEKTNKVDVFLSRKSEDKHLSLELYEFLNSKNLNVFDSEVSLPALGNADYRQAIDQALDAAQHLIVIGSKVEHIISSWVQAEWGFFIGEKRAGRKKGNLITIITEGIDIESLPPSLRNYEVIIFKKENFERILAYVGGNQEFITDNKKNYNVLGQAKQAYLKADFETAFKLFKQIENNSSEAIFYLGRMYEQGFPPFGKDLEKAKNYYQKAIEKGNDWGYFGLGVIEDDENQLQGYFKKAVETIYLDATNGDIMAHFLLGEMYSNGWGIERNYEKAFYWYEKAANQGYAYAQNNLGFCIYEGQGVKQDYEKAFYWFEKAANQGNASAQYNFGMCYDNGKGVKQDEAKAFYWYEKAANQGYANAQFNLGWCYDKGNGVKPDKEKAFYWYEKAANQGNENAIAALKNLK